MVEIVGRNVVWASRELLAKAQVEGRNSRCGGFEQIVGVYAIGFLHALFGLLYSPTPYMSDAVGRLQFNKCHIWGKGL